MHEEAGTARRGHPHPAARFEDSEVRHQQWFGTHPSTRSAIEAPLPNRQKVAGMPDFSQPRRHHVCGVAHVFRSRDRGRRKIFARCGRTGRP
jgi:hypothetical protein